MRIQYQENPLLFLNSSGPVARSGRNVRSAERSKAAQANATPNQTGYFGQIQLNTKRDNDEPKTNASPKRRKAIASPKSPCHAGTQRLQEDLPSRVPSSGVVVSRSVSPGPSLDPSEILAVATL
jgi:hypothetical protein